MSYRLEIGLKRGVVDTRGRSAMTRARDYLGLKIRSVNTRTVYLIGADLSRNERRSVKDAFTDPVIEKSAFGRLKSGAFDWLIEVGFNPGVTDNVGRTASAALADVLGRDLSGSEAVFTAVQYLVKAPELTREQASRFAREVLANELIQSVKVCSRDEWNMSDHDDSLPVIEGSVSASVGTFDLSGSDEELVRISSEKLLSCSLEEMQTIRDYFRSPHVLKARRAAGLPDDPTDVEVECIAQTWSEHCSHKIFAGRIKHVNEDGSEEWIDSLYKTYIKASTKKIAENIDWLVSVFTDNAGVIKFNDHLNVVYKVETHNSPSALDPYGGAMTGIVGVNRDPMGTGLGSALLCNVWGYCLASPFYDRQVPEGLMHPRRIRDGVHQGVIEGGNQSGIPWTRGWEIFDDRYLGKPLVFCGTVGLIPSVVAGRPCEVKEVVPGDRVVMLGGRIGKDGIHGATFSSEELRQESPVQAVQIGDPITQRKMYEFLMEARDLGLYRCITDNGAGGLSCSVGEMGELCGGAELDLEKAPLKYQGLEPWEILLSEAQERMTLAVEPSKIDEFMKLAARRDVEAADLGIFTDSGVFLIKYGDRVVGRLDMEFLYDGCPVMVMESEWAPTDIPAPCRLRKGKRNKHLKGVLSSLNVCSKEYKSRQYDGEVKGLSVVKPYVGKYSDMPSDATVMRAEYHSNQGIALAEGINPFYSDIDTYHMMGAVIDEAVRRIISVGGSLDCIAGLDNFCWPDPVLSEKTPDGKHKLAQLVRANRALYEYTTAFGVPCISGKDSMKNDSTRGGRKISIPPTVLFSTIGRIDDVRNVVTMNIKRRGDIVYVVGRTRDELGASSFYRWLALEQGQPANYGGNVPVLNVKEAVETYNRLSRAIAGGLVRSSHTPSKGGLAVALALSAMGGDLGVDIDLSKTVHDKGLDDDAVLFSESNSRFVVTVAPEKKHDFETAMQGVPVAEVGVVSGSDSLKISGLRGRSLVDVRLSSLRKAFTSVLRGV